MSLQYFLDQQSELQRKMPSPHPLDLYRAFTQSDQSMAQANMKPAIDFLHWNVTATTDELHELLGEIGWKPWAKSRHINIAAARGEWIDAFHFMLNMGLVLGMDEAMIKSLYDAKHAKNGKRQEEGYDGVSTKCPGCKRALDDLAVECTVRQGRLGSYEGPLNWCAVLGRQFIPDSVKESGR